MDTWTLVHESMHPQEEKIKNEINATIASQILVILIRKKLVYQFGANCSCWQLTLGTNGLIGEMKASEHGETERHVWPHYPPQVPLPVQLLGQVHPVPVQAGKGVKGEGGGRGPAAASLQPGRPVQEGVVRNEVRVPAVAELHVAQHSDRCI